MLVECGITFSGMQSDVRHAVIWICANVWNPHDPLIRIQQEPQVVLLLIVNFSFLPPIECFFVYCFMGIVHGDSPKYHGAHEDCEQSE